MKYINNLIDNNVEDQKRNHTVLSSEKILPKEQDLQFYGMLVFKNLEISSYFYPFDIKSEGLEKLISFLKSDKNFLGGAVAVPHKETIIDCLDYVDTEALKIGAVNLIYRKDGMLCGSNTDGIGAVASLSEFLNKPIDQFAKDKSAIVLGTGGTAKACSVYLAKSIGKNGNLIIIGRDIKSAEALAKKCKSYCNSSALTFNKLTKVIKEVSFVVNCTVIGFENEISYQKKTHYYKPFIPLVPISINGFSNNDENGLREWFIDNYSSIQQNNLSSFELFKQFNLNTVFFDVIYQPNTTAFLDMAKGLGYRTLSEKDEYNASGIWISKSIWPLQFFYRKYFRYNGEPLI